MTEPTEPWLTKKPWEVRNARLIQRERYNYIAFGIAVVLMTMAAMFLFSGCGTIQKVLDPHRCDGAGYLTHMDCV